MKKMVYGALLVGSSLLALDTQWFIGAGAAYADINAKLNTTGSITVGGTTYTASTSDQSDKDTALELKAGAIVNTHHRLSVNYAKYEPSKGAITATLTNVVMNYDYLLDPINRFTFFGGVHGGMNKFEAIGYDDTAMTYGLQAGVLYPLIGNFELDAGVSYSKLGSKPTTPTLNGTYSGVVFNNASASLEAKDMTAFHCGINYKF